MHYKHLTYDERWPIAYYLSMGKGLVKWVDYCVDRIIR